ncbi:MAG TPA: YdeI/OmpD-associated family protein [Candidatus Limnocylindrales bacterium]|nr:YdeI/OmpD-associated family protein [Candidatus Limnocylindrales bacterium]
MASPGEPIFFETPTQLRHWLDEHHQTAADLIVGAWKKATGKPTLTWPEIVEEALCVGWIDSIRRSVPGDGWTIRLTPRRKGSIWSAVNVAKVAELRAAGRMRPAGEAAVAARRADRTAIYSFEQARDPVLTADEEARFRRNETAWAWFAARSPSFRKQALHWVISAKKPETRERRLSTLIADSAAGRPVGPMSYSKADAPPKST